MGEAGHWPTSSPAATPSRRATASPGDGRSFEVLLAGQRLGHEVQKTGDWSNFQSFPLGEMTIAEGGRLVLEVRATKLPGGGLMNLQSVTLRPVE
ncbi:MAG: hypothetical protein M5U09_22645 [Gammaproteobacteria bacterium]|nr:hypothetical protein [Gammaproteobacteria bacterium]